MPLSQHRGKRQSGRSPEPPGRRARRRRADSGPRFVIQHHAARSVHHDFRLEIDGVLVSWAIPKGPSTNPKDKRMARRKPVKSQPESVLSGRALDDLS
jgi:DNA ligase D-like protein (predicted 3'-phosphoesterase)